MVTVMVMQCERCAQLEEELAARKRADGDIETVNNLQALFRWFSLSKGQARIVMRLYRAKHRFLPLWLVAGELINPDSDEQTAVVQISKIRKKLGDDAIETADQRNGAYRLSPAMMIRVRDALEAGA